MLYILAADFQTLILAPCHKQA